MKGLHIVRSAKKDWAVNERTLALAAVEITTLRSTWSGLCP